MNRLRKPLVLVLIGLLLASPVLQAQDHAPEYSRAELAPEYTPAELTAAAAPYFRQNNWSLEITSPLPCDGAAEPNGALTGARHCKAYPALLYRHPVACIGGTFPYTYAVENGPAWLSVTSDGVLSGTPTDTTTDDDASITVRCTDFLSATTTRTFGIDVTTSGFFFVDKVNGTYRVGNGGCVSSCGTGTLANPWKDLEDVFDGTSSDSDAVYFRGCTGCGTGANAWTYTTDNITLNAQDNSVGEEEIQWGNSAHANIFLNYPGESPRLDFAYTGDGCGNPSSPSYACGQSVPRLELGSGRIYWDGFQVWRCMTMCFEVNRTDGRGAVFTNNFFHSGGPGINGGNSAWGTWERSESHMTYGDIVWGNTFRGAGIVCGSTYSMIKTYDTQRFLIALNTVTGGTTGNCGDALFALKGGPFMSTVRQNTVTDLASNDLWLGGDMAESDDPLHVQFSMEASFNLCISLAPTNNFNGCLAMGRGLQPINFIESYIWRNTFYGPVTWATFDNSGPFEWKDNVVINADTGGSFPRITESGMLGLTGIVYGTNPATADGNLLGGVADGIINTSTGDLLGSNLTTYGPTSGNPKGHMLSAAIPGGGGTNHRSKGRIRMRGKEPALSFREDSHDSQATRYVLSLRRPGIRRVRRRPGRRPLGGPAERPAAAAAAG